VHHIVTRLELPDIWQFELAAMLSQLGCVTVPAETLEKVYTGRALAAAEQQAYAKHPTIGHELICRIPRLETVAEMIIRQHDPYANKDAFKTAQKRDQALMGAHILNVVLDFDQLVSQGMSHADAVKQLLQQPDAYGIVAALQDMEAEKQETVRHLVSVRDLYPGMIQAEDIRAKTGLLVIAKGHEVTYAMMERLRSYA
jgi:hypothetical protein